MTRSRRDLRITLYCPFFSVVRRAPHRVRGARSIRPPPDERLMLRSTVRLLAAHPRLTALFGAISIAFSGVLYEFSETSPETASFFRCLWGLPILFVAAYIEQGPGGRGRDGPPRDRSSPRLPASSSPATSSSGTTRSTSSGPGSPTVLGNLQVVVVAHRRVDVVRGAADCRTLVALPIILLGVVFIAAACWAARTTARTRSSAWSWASSPRLSYGGYLLVIRRISGRRTAGPVAISTTSTASLPSSLASRWARSIYVRLGVDDLADPAGVSAQAIGYLFISLSLPRLPAVVTSIILLAQPVVVVAWRWSSGETPSAGQLLGVACVIGGIAFATVPLSRFRRRRLGQLAPPGPAGDRWARLSPRLERRPRTYWPGSRSDVARRLANFARPYDLRYATRRRMRTCATRNRIAAGAPMGRRPHSREGVPLRGPERHSC